MRINHNLMAMNANRYLSSTGTLQSKSLEKISSGLRINSAADDAAGLAISEKMRAQIRGLEQSSRNAQDGISLIQTAEGALQETHSILQRMRQLAVQASNGTNDDADRSDMQKEVTQLKSEIDRIATDTEFNKKKILNGSMGKTITDGATTTLSLKNLQALGMELETGTYSIKKTATANTFTPSANGITTSADPTVTLTAGADIKYGEYELKAVKSGATWDLTLTGPNGSVTTVSGVNADFNGDVGGLNFDFSAAAANNLNTNGTMKVNVTATSTFELSSTTPGFTTKSVTVTDYAGGDINVGGYHFEMTTNSGAANTQYDFQMNSNAVQFQIGANANQSIKLAVNDMSAMALGVNDIDISNTTGAESAITTISTAIERVSGERSKLGAVQNRLEHTIKNLDTSTENLQASESRIRDVDIAKEMMNYTKLNILQQAAQSMLAQANQAPQGVLQLLR